MKYAKILYYALLFLINISSLIQANDENILEDYELTGLGRKIAIIDKHFSPNSSTKKSLTASAKNAFKNMDEEELNFQAEQVGDNHANHTFDIIIQKAPDVLLRVIDMANESSVNHFSGDNARFIAAIDAAILSGVDFINISQRISPDHNRDGQISKDLKEAFYRARDAGIGIIKSAGNDYEVIGMTPYTKSLTKLLHKMKGSMTLVVATDKDNNRLLDDSNKAGTAHRYSVAAPGKNILAYGASTLIQKSGTSMAAAAVSATAVLIKQRFPEFSARDVLNSIRYSARKFERKTFFLKEEHGQGISNLEAALKKAKDLNRCLRKGRLNSQK